jgi:hypothetical protein
MYYEEIKIVPLKQPLTKEERLKILELHKNSLDIPFDILMKDKINLISTKLFNFSFKEDSDEFFCSEYVAFLLRGIGRLPKETNISIMDPKNIHDSDALDRDSAIVVKLI